MMNEIRFRINPGKNFDENNVRLGKFRKLLNPGLII